MSKAIKMGQERQCCHDGKERCSERRPRWSRWSGSLAKASEASVDCDERILSQAGGMSIVPFLFGTRGKWPETLLIRHPSYTGLLITLLGYGLSLTNWLSLLVLMGCALIGFSYRIHVEEHVLQAQLGQRYQEYMRRTKRLIPFVL